MPIGELYALPLGEDLTGDNTPDIAVLEAEQVGNGGICNMNIFEIGECFRHIATFSDCGYFEDRDGDGKFEVNLPDETFRYWRVWISDPPIPTVILRYDTRFDKYVLADDLMLRPAPSQNVFTAMIDRVRKADNDYKGNGPPLILWEMMIELLYSGHEDVAWLLYEQSWLPRFGDEASWATRFKAQLAESHYWKHLSSFQFLPWRSVSEEYPALLQRPSYSSQQQSLFPVGKAYEVQCGSVVTCDLTQCTASPYDHGAGMVMYYPTEKSTPIHVILMLTYQKQARVVNLFGKDEQDGLCFDAPCDSGTSVFLIHKSSQQTQQ